MQQWDIIIIRGTEFILTTKENKVVIADCKGISYTKFDTSTNNMIWTVGTYSGNYEHVYAFETPHRYRQ